MKKIQKVTTPTSYKVALRESDPDSFYFTTHNGINYEVRFRPSGYIFSDELDLQPFIFEISILILENSSGVRPPSDPLVSTTITLIFGQFFEQHERVAVYICDTSDQRGLARPRKFTSWFDQYRGSYVKYSDSILDEDGEVYFTSLIARRDNPNLGRMINAFTNLVNGNSK